MCVFFAGVTDYLSAEISTSKQKKFSLVTFVDTPGLVDGDMIYPFDVNRAITSFGKTMDLATGPSPRLVRERIWPGYPYETRKKRRFLNVVTESLLICCCNSSEIGLTNSIDLIN